MTPTINWFDLEPRKGVENRVPWTPGMTEREWFNSNLRCGELPRSGKPVGPILIAAPPPCGASDWRVIKLNLMRYNERSLKCLKCGYWTDVEIPGMPTPV